MCGRAIRFRRLTKGKLAEWAAREKQVAGPHAHAWRFDALRTATVRERTKSAIDREGKRESNLTDSDLSRDQALKAG